MRSPCAHPCGLQGCAGDVQQAKVGGVLRRLVLSVQPVPGALCAAESLLQAALVLRCHLILLEAHNEQAVQRLPAELWPLPCHAALILSASSRLLQHRKGCRTLK